MSPTNEQELLEVLEPLIKRGMAEMSAGHFEKAIRTFRRCIELAPLRQDVRDLLAMALDNKAPTEIEGEEDDDDWDDVEELIDESEPSMELKVQPKKSHVRLPGWLMAMTVLLCILAVSGIWGFNQYRPELEEFFQRIKTLGQPEHVVLAGNYYKDALRRLELQEYEEAITLLDQAIDTNPAEGAVFGALKAQIYLALGDVELDDKKYQQALTSYQKAVDADPESAEAWFDIGLCQYNLARDALRRRQSRSADDHNEKAIEALKRVLEIDGDDLRSMRLLMETYPKLVARRTETRDICWEIIEKFPDDPAANKAKKILATYGLPEQRPGRSAPAASTKTPPTTNTSGR